MTTAFVLGWKVLASLPLCHSERAVDTIVFSVTNKSGTPWASDSDVLAFNKAGFDAAAHISVNGGVATGFAAQGQGGPR